MFDVRWVHAFEEDTPGEHVYRQATDDLPLSRRPREAFELHRDGTAQIIRGGPDDRGIAEAARWTETPDGIVVVQGVGSVTLRIVRREPGRLIVSQG